MLFDNWKLVKLLSAYSQTWFLLVVQAAEQSFSTDHVQFELTLRDREPEFDLTAWLGDGGRRWLGASRRCKIHSTAASIYRPFGQTSVVSLPATPPL